MKRAILKTIYISLFITAFTSSSNAQDERIKALFIYNFTKYIEWPEDYKQGNFVIAVFGETLVYDLLLQNTATRKVAVQDISVKKFLKISDIEMCHILYVPAQKASMLKEINSAISKWPVLLITEIPNGITEGASLNFIKVNDKQTFEISTEMLTKKKLAYSSTLLKLGIQAK